MKSHAEIGAFPNLEKRVVLISNVLIFCFNVQNPYFFNCLFWEVLSSFIKKDFCIEFEKEFLFHAESFHKTLLEDHRYPDICHFSLFLKTLSVQTLFFSSSHFITCSSWNFGRGKSPKRETTFCFEIETLSVKSFL